MKIVNYFGLCVIAMAIVSCGGSKNKDSGNLVNDTVILENGSSVYEQQILEESLNASYENDGTEELESDLEETDGEDWDAVLDSYEDYVDSYISMLEKAQAGDMDALSEYPTFLQKAQELGQKMSVASSELSASQLNRYNRINQKMINAAQGMN